MVRLLHLRTAAALVFNELFFPKLDPLIGTLAAFATFGAVFFAVEYAPEGKRGLFGSWAPIGVTMGNLMAAGVFALVTMLPREDFLAWGWRIPFLLSALLVA